MTETPMSPDRSEEHNHNYELPGQLLQIAEHEIGRIILDIHDGPVQHIFAALSQLNIVQRHLRQREQQGEEDGEESAQNLERLRKSIGLLEHALNEIRTFMGMFRPPEFERRTLLAVLDGLVIQHEELTGHAVTIDLQGSLPDVPLPVKIALYRVLQQALSNSSRHASVKEHLVTLHSDAQTITMEVADRGCGFDVTRVLEQQEGIRFGLTGMRERVEILGGTFEIESTVGVGTWVRVVVPYR
ncbi:MAG: hypothetical protein HC884_03665 [Chloroflexaceae bacterium]|nr:hypothetical protein [Chloroflexaceae bacterium]